MRLNNYTPDSVAAEVAFLNATKAENDIWCLKIMNFGKQRVEFTAFMPNKGAGMVSLLPRKKRELTDDERAARSERIAVARARRMVRHLVKGLEANHMLTLTYRGAMVDEKRLQSDIQAFARRVRDRYPDWKYIGVKERHESGGWHMHCAVHGRQDVVWLRKCWWSEVGEGEGNIDVQGPSKRWGNEGSKWGVHKLAGYMCKYLAKEFGNVAANKKRYWASRGIDLPAPIYYWLGSTNFPDAVVETWDYVKAYRCTKTKMFAQEDWALLYIDSSG